MKPVLSAALMVLIMFPVGFSQQNPPAPKTGQPLRAEQLVDEWFNRMNALDDWYISLDGKEQPEEVVNSIADLWTNDWYLRDYYSISPDKNPKGPDTGKYKVIRGGGWSDEDITVMVNFRNYTDAEQKSFTIGFRCAKSAQ